MKNMKRLLAVMLVLTMALCMVACSQPQDTPTTTKPAADPEPTTTASQAPTQTPTSKPAATPSHTVLVLDQDGNPVSGIVVQLCDEGTCYDPQVTNEEGIASFFLPGITGAKAKVFPNGLNDPTHPYGRTDYTIDVNPNATADGYVPFGDSTTLTLTVTKVAE